MIKPLYAGKLARTKLRSKKAMVATSIVVASLLFAALIAIIILFTGAEKSAERFTKAAGNDAYLVRVQRNIPAEVQGFQEFPLSLETVRALKAFEKTFYEGEKARFKRLEVPYDATREEPILKPSSYIDAPTEEQKVMPNFQSPALTAYFAQRLEEYEKTATNKFVDMERLALSYDSKATHKLSMVSSPEIPGQRLIQNGKEDFGSKRKDEASMTGVFKNSIFNSSYTFASQPLLKRYLFQNQEVALKGVPVIVSVQEFVKLYGKQLSIPEEPSNQKQRIEWLGEVQKKARGITYETCYRNPAELSMLDKIQTDYAEMKASAGKEGYKKPSLQYAYPAEACGAITIATDTRTSDEKKLAATLEQQQKKLGTYQAPAHRKITYQIVGLQYAQDVGDATKSADDFARSLLSGDAYGMPVATIPTELYKSLPDNLRHEDIFMTSTIEAYGIPRSDIYENYVFEFPSPEIARSFIQKEACSPNDSPCKKPYIASAYGSNYLILNDIGKTFTKLMAIAFPAFLAFAAVIIWFTISRIMAESRKETAVYRAMGARRSDIAGIYLTYIGIIALIMAVVSFVVGAVAAHTVNYLYGPQLEMIAVSSFGIVENAPHFSLFDVTSLLIWIVIGAIFVVSFVASLQPLLRNVLRAPVKDMRSE